MLYYLNNILQPSLLDSASAIAQVDLAQVYSYHVLNYAFLDMVDQWISSIFNSEVVDK